MAGICLAARELIDLETPESETRGKEDVAEAVKSVASQLGSTPAVCRKSYIHPAIIDAYLDRSLIQSWNAMDAARLAELFPGYGREEAVVLSLLRGAGK